MKNGLVFWWFISVVAGGYHAAGHVTVVGPFSSQEQCEKVRVAIQRATLVTPVPCWNDGK